jgi:signal transduction histidine kinase
MEGQLDYGVPDEIAEQLLAVLREALSNVVRHAKAAKASVAVEVSGDELALTVQDDGVGLPREGRRSGLRNLEERATGLGGSFAVTSPETGGTVLSWAVPL